jgi:hypothetical protein
MRVAARKLIDAYRAGKSKGAGNSSVSFLRMNGSNRVDFVTFSLHGHPIVTVNPAGEVHVSFAGWPTPTTRSRINDLCYGLIGKCPVSQMKFGQYVSGHGEVSAAHGAWYLVGKVAR